MSEDLKKTIKIIYSITLIPIITLFFLSQFLVYTVLGVYFTIGGTIGLFLQIPLLSKGWKFADVSNYSGADIFYNILGLVLGIYILIISIFYFLNT